MTDKLQRGSLWQWNCPEAISPKPMLVRSLGEWHAKWFDMLGDDFVRVIDEHGNAWSARLSNLVPPPEGAVFDPLKQYTDLPSVFRFVGIAP